MAKRKKKGRERERFFLSSSQIDKSRGRNKLSSTFFAARRHRCLSRSFLPSLSPPQPSPSPTSPNPIQFSTNPLPPPLPEPPRPATDTSPSASATWSNVLAASAKPDDPDSWPAVVSGGAETTFDNLHEMFRKSVQVHGESPCLGSREILPNDEVSGGWREEEERERKREEEEKRREKS